MRYICPMQQILSKYLPQNAVEPCFELIKNYNIYLKIVNERKTRHGDYRQLPSGQHKITINANLNKYRFLMTLIHEIAHLVAHIKYGWQIKPHGNEWKYTFQCLMSPFLRPDIFPPSLLILLARHFQNPTASSDTDVALWLEMQKYNPNTENKFCIFELPQGSFFRMKDGTIFQKGHKKIKRYECINTKNRNIYLIQPHTLVEWLPNFKM